VSGSTRKIREQSREDEQAKSLQLKSGLFAPNRYKTKLNPIQLVENKRREPLQIATKMRFFEEKAKPKCVFEQSALYFLT
jgi:hypothetical protein